MKSNPQRILISILAISVLFRVLAALFLGDTVEDLPGTNDQISYHALALRLLDGYGFTFGEPWWPLTAENAPTAHWSYLYTFFLTGVYGLFGIHPVIPRLIQAILVGTLHPYLVYRLGSRVFNPRVGQLAAALTAFYAYFIYYDGTLMTEPFYITAILGALNLAIDWVAPQTDTDRRIPLLPRSLALGLVLGTAILLRQLFLLMVPFLFLWIWWAKRERGAGSAIPGLVLSVLVIGVMILPFTLYNYSRFGRFVLLNTNAGYAFYWGNHPIYGRRFIPILQEEMGSYQSLVPVELRGLDEAALDQELLRRGLGFVTSDPWRYTLLSLSRIPAYFMFWPSEESGLISNLSRVGSFGLLLPLMAYGLLRSLYIKPRPFRYYLGSPLFLLHLFILVYTGIHILSWALIRYRLPVDAILVIFAGFAVGYIFARNVRLEQPGRLQASL